MAAMKLAGAEKRHSTEQRNTVTMRVTADLSPENWTAVNEKVPVGLAIDRKRAINGT